MQISPESDLVSAGFKYYFGPVHYTTLKAYNEGAVSSSDKLELQEIVSLGYKWLSWVNKWFVIPVFNFFLDLNWNMGLIILILTGNLFFFKNSYRKKYRISSINNSTIRCSRKN